MNSSYLTSAQLASQLPPYGEPEIAFIGRSNCGKSSLLNNLLGRKNLARTSARPGSTQMVNFFRLEVTSDNHVIFADLPGYGYHSAPGAVRGQWQELLDAYFLRPNLSLALCLCDIRRDWEGFELAFMRQLSQRVPLRVVLTKIDKVTAKELNRRSKEVQAVMAKHRIAVEKVHFVSNTTKKGVEELQGELLTIEG